MNKNKKIVLYAILFALGLTGLILQAFVIEAPDGILGFLLCLLCIYLMLGSIIKLCKISDYFKNTVLATTIDILFWLP